MYNSLALRLLIRLWYIKKKKKQIKWLLEIPAEIVNDNQEITFYLEF